MVTHAGALFIYESGKAPQLVVTRTDEWQYGKAAPAGDCVCLFGSHPRLILWLWNGSVYSVDIRKAKVCMLCLHIHVLCDVM